MSIVAGQPATAEDVLTALDAKASLTSATFTGKIIAPSALVSQTSDGVNPLSTGVAITRDGNGLLSDGYSVDSRYSINLSNEAYLWNFQNGYFKLTVNGAPTSVGNVLVGELVVNSSKSNNPNFTNRSQYSAVSGIATRNTPSGGYAAAGGPEIWPGYFVMADNTNLKSSISGAMLIEVDINGNAEDDGNARTGVLFTLKEQTALSDGGYPLEVGTAIGFTNGSATLSTYKTLVNLAGTISVAALDMRSSNKRTALVASAASVGATTVSVDNVIGFTSSTYLRTPVSVANPSLIQIGTRIYKQTGYSITAAGSYAGTITLDASTPIAGTDGAVGKVVVPAAHTMWLREMNGTAGYGNSIALNLVGDKLVRYNGTNNNFEFVSLTAGLAPSANFNIDISTGSISGSGNASFPIGSISAATLTTTGYLFKSVAVAQGAAGTGQSDATLIAASYNEFTTVASGTGCRLPAVSAACEIVVFNEGANALNVYPPTGDKIDSASVNAAAATPITAFGGHARYVWLKTGQWRVA
jgi:hypothetical protein